MALVNFENVDLTEPSGLPGTGVPQTGLYDPLWGYYSFGQQQVAHYNEAECYWTQARFMIEGYFTIDAEDAAPGMAGTYVDPDTGQVIDEAAALVAMSQRYEALETAFNQAAGQSRPSAVEQWYSANDPRCLALPERLTDQQGQRIYGLPQQLSVIESRWPVMLHYQAVLLEGPMPPSMLLVNQVPLESARLLIDAPRPMIVQRRMIAAEGAVIHIQNYTQTRVHLQGILPTASGEDLSEQAAALARSLVDGTMDVERISFSNGRALTSTLFSDLLVEQPTIDLQPTERGVRVAVVGVY